jgi:uncharacterized membrane protein
MESSGALSHVAEVLGSGIEATGVIAIVIGVGWALSRFAVESLRDQTRQAAFQRARSRLGRAILLGLELLVAGDIIRTVAVTPTFTSVGVLAVIVAIRTFLSFTLEVEITGRWPWQAKPQDEQAL